MFLADAWTDYEVIDTGDGEKLERWGQVILRRPDPQTIWPKADERLWKQAQELGDFDVEKLAERLCEEYDVTAEQAQSDIAAIVAEWQQVGVLE